MIDLLRSGAALTLPLLPHLLRARGSGGSTAAGWTPLHQRASPAGLPEADASPCYSCSDEDGEAEEEESDAVAAAAAAAAAADGMLESPLMQAERISRQFGLNQEQAEVLQYVAGWASVAGSSGGTASKRRGSMGAAAAEVQPPPVCLVHGPFGSGEEMVTYKVTCTVSPCNDSSNARPLPRFTHLLLAAPSCCSPAGKSTLLVALLHFLLQQRSREGSPLAGARMLVRCGCLCGMVACWDAADGMLNCDSHNGSSGVRRGIEFVHLVASCL